MVVKFEQAYHYMVGCPLRQYSENPIPRSPLAQWFEDNTVDIFINMFSTNGDFLIANNDFQRRLEELEKEGRIYDKRLKIRLFQSAAVNTSLFIKERLETPFHPVGNFTAAHMDALVHLSRLKPNNTLELIWFVFEPVLPDLDTRNIYSFYVNWNARAYEIAFNIRPYRLTLYYPLIGDSILYIYNTESRMDVVAELIHKGVFYAKPSFELCSACRACPEYLRMRC